MKCTSYPQSYTSGRMQRKIKGGITEGRGKRMIGEGYNYLNKSHTQKQTLLIAKCNGDSCLECTIFRSETSTR